MKGELVSLAQVKDSDELKTSHVISGWSQAGPPGMSRLEELPVLRLLSSSRRASTLHASSPIEQRRSSN